MPAKKKKIFKLNFVQEWGTYSNQTLVCVNLTYPEIVAAAKKNDSNKIFMQWLADEKENLEKRIKTADGFLAFNEHSQSILWLKQWEDIWKNIETLMHECFHAVYDMLMVHKSMHGETEALAYQQEYLFRNIRRHINKHYYKGRKKRK